MIVTHYSVIVDGRELLTTTDHDQARALLMRQPAVDSHGHAPHIGIGERCDSCGYPVRTDAACQDFRSDDVCCDRAGETHGRAHSGACLAV